MDDLLPESLPSSPEDEARRQAEFETTLDDALDDTPRADELRQLRDVLRRRQSILQRDYDISSDPEERAHLQKLLDELDVNIGVLDEEARVVLERLPIQRVQHSMAGAIGGGARALRGRTLAEFGRHAAEGALVDAAVLGA